MTQETNTKNKKAIKQMESTWNEIVLEKSVPFYQDISKMTRVYVTCRRLILQITLWKQPCDRRLDKSQRLGFYSDTAM